MSEFAWYCYGVFLIMASMAAAVVAWSVSQWGHSLNRARRDKLLRTLVLAAEQLYGPGKGEVKRRFVRERLNQKGLADTVGRDDLEAMVYECFGNRSKEAGQ